MSGKAPDRREEPVEIIGILTALINMITAVILWQTAKRNRRRD